MTRFAVIGLDHRHVYDLAAGLIEAGEECAGYWPETSDPRVLAGFQKRFPDVPAREKQALLEDASIASVVIAAVPRDRAGIAIEAMRHGKDVMVDKPGVTSFAQLAEVERVVAESGRIFSVCFSERFLTASTQVALRLVREGAIGRVVQTVGLGPHRLNRALRPSWFFDAAQFGGILVDIGSHQIDQFLAFADAADAQVVTSTVGEFGTQDGFEDFGEMILRSASATGYARVDWFTPDGLASWGDVRLTVTGTEGTMELRKNLDIAGRPGADHLFLVDNKETRHIDCTGTELSYFRDFARDVAERTEIAMPQAHVFTVCRLALEAQEKAIRFRAQVR
jgi:predicted dehydrogenase